METLGVAFSKTVFDSRGSLDKEEYATQSKLLMEFTNLSTINKAWIFKSHKGNASRAMFSIGQPSLSENKKKIHILFSHIEKKDNNMADLQWSPFPIEMVGASTIVPSPSGSKVLVVKNKENGSSTKLEIWGPSMLLKEIHIPDTVHGTIYTDGWFEGISWNHNEALIAYVAEESSPPKPVFDGFGYKNGSSDSRANGTWTGQGDWEEDWGEAYSGKRKPTLFVIDVNSNEVRAVKGIGDFLSVGQVVWAPLASKFQDQWLVFAAWPAFFGDKHVPRKLGIKYCYNRPCALYAAYSPFTRAYDPEHVKSDNATKDLDAAIKLTDGINSAFFPRFSPDGKFLLFLSAKTSVDSGAHCATNSLHKVYWSIEKEITSPLEIIDVIPVTPFGEDGCFPGLYCSKILDQPWLSDGHTLILSSIWGSAEVILSINTLRGRVRKISPTDSSASWNVIAMDGNNVLAVCSTLASLPQLKYGFPTQAVDLNVSWDWSNIDSPSFCHSEKVKNMLSSLQYQVMKIPVKNITEDLLEGAKGPLEAIFVSNKDNGKFGSCDPLIVILHGGPHSVISTSYSKSFAFLASLGFNLLIVNYRGSLGFGEEALQSLLGKIGKQDVNDVLTALEHVIKLGLVDSSKVALLGGSHGGFLATHLIGQAPERFAAAVVRNPVCNLGLMVETTDIPDWCYVESFGSEGKVFFTEAHSAEEFSVFFKKSPVHHVKKVRSPVLFLLGAKDIRVPVANGLQYARALKESCNEVKVIFFPDDNHALDSPQTDFESYLNIGVWFKKYCR